MKKPTKPHSITPETPHAQSVRRTAKNREPIAQDAVRRRRGGVSKFTPERWERILKAIALHQDLFAICAEPGMPNVETIYDWIRRDPKLKEDIRGSWELFSYIGHSYNHNVLSGGHLSTGCLKRDIEIAADNRWHMSKTNRRDFGDKTQVEVTVHEPLLIESSWIPGQLIEPSKDDD